MAQVVVRQMTAPDLERVGAVSDDAFVTLIEGIAGRPIPRPFFPELLFSTRLALDPAGCLVAVDGEAGGALVGAIFSVARGSLAWFGPLAVAPAAQGRGVGQALTAALLDRWRARGARLMGLETFGSSDLHLHLYAKFGFRPEWTSLAFHRAITPEQAAGDADPEVVVNGPPPDLDFLYDGLDLRADAAQTVSTGLGVTLATGGGFAILHTRPTFTGPESGFLLFAAAPDRSEFTRLLAAAERECAARGLTKLVTRAPGNNFGALYTLVDRGYRAGMVMARMKQGERPDYDAARVCYCDSWL